ncbi:MAG: DinB family protein [Actinomycetota bacterium]|nr:DinB family protein [Actinomycetota bacterium]
MTTERKHTPFEGSEKELLEATLDYHRATLLLKSAGLSEHDLRREMTPSGTSLLGLVKHLAYVERWWFQWVHAGDEVSFPWTDDDPNADFRVEPEETAEQVFDLYRAETQRNHRIAAEAELDAVARRPHRDEARPNLRWVLLHMIQETARHNGHADVLRELIDGTTGE